jgi:hypothetical protein
MLEKQNELLNPEGCKDIVKHMGECEDIVGW